MQKGEVILNSTRCFNATVLQCYSEVQAFASFRRKLKYSTSARKDLVIRCARQRPQRSGTPKPGPLNVPSNGSGGQADDEYNFLESNPNHRAGKPTTMDWIYTQAFISWSVWAYMPDYPDIVTSCGMLGASCLGSMVGIEQVPGITFRTCLA